MDDPNAKAHGTHFSVTPLVGGIALFAGWIPIAWLFAAYPPADYSGSGLQLGLALPAFLGFTLLLGALDDHHHLSARSRLYAKTVAYFVLVTIFEQYLLHTLIVPSLGLNVKLGLLSVPLSVLCLVALTNAVNMADGRNCLVIGLSMIWIAALTYRVPALAHPIVLALLPALAIVGWFNWRGRLFLGDAGAYTLASLVGLLALWAHNQPIALGGLTSSQLATLFAIPGFDMVRLIFARLSRGASPLAADSDHLHHRLERLAGWKIGLPVYLLAVGIPIFASLTGPRTGLVGFALAFMFYLILWRVTAPRDGTELPAPAAQSE